MQPAFRREGLSHLRPELIEQRILFVADRLDVSLQVVEYMLVEPFVGLQRCPVVRLPRILRFDLLDDSRQRLQFAGDRQGDAARFRGRAVSIILSGRKTDGYKQKTFWKASAICRIRSNRHHLPLL